MNRALLSLFLVGVTVPALAADLAYKAKDAPPPAPSQFYVGIHAGVGVSNQQSDITLPGVATGTPAIWPAGFMAGAVAGVGANTPLGYVGGEIEADYDFTHASIGCTGALPCMGTSKNSWFFAEKGLWGFSLGTIAGYVPANAQPSNWPIPITVPASFAANLRILAEAGVAQRNQDICALDLGTLNQACGSRWMNGLLLGGQLQWAVSQSVTAKAEYNWINFNQSFTPQNALSIFPTAFQSKQEQRFMLGFNYNLPAGGFFGM
jgi:opacity protein-like surface antigen